MLTTKGYAKINLTLDVLERREDGYHDIVSIMQTVNLYDTLTFEKTKAGIKVSCDKELDCGDKNTAYRACRLIMNGYGIEGGVSVHINKNIPIAAGLGGGSADAAAAIEGMNEMFSLNMTVSDMKKIGLQIGADVPFCVSKGAAVAKGIGEKLISFKAKTLGYVVLVKPDVHISTKETYEKIDGIDIQRRPDTNMAIAALKAADFENLGQNLYNVMEYVTSEEYPVIKLLKEQMIHQGASGSLMSGSGPTVFGVFTNKILAQNAYNYFKGKYVNFEVFVCSFYFP